MNHPEVRILTIRRYTWTSWPRPVSGGPKLLVPSPQGVYSISVHPNWLATSVWRTSASIMPTARHLSVSFNLGMAYQRRLSKLSWFSVLQASTLCLNTCLVDKRVCDLTAAWKQTWKTKTLAKQTNYPCNPCTDQCKWPGWIHNLPV